MFNPNEYLDTVEHDGIVAAIERDPSAHRFNPLDDLGGSIAVLTVDGDEWERRAFDRLGDAEGAVSEARRSDADDPDAAALEAFRRHYARKGWTVEEFTILTYKETDRARVCIAVDAGYGTPSQHARDLECWACGNVYAIDFYAPYTCEVGGETMTEMLVGETLGNVYLPDALGTPEAIAEVKSIIEDQSMCNRPFEAPATVNATWTLALEI